MFVGDGRMTREKACESGQWVCDIVMEVWVVGYLGSGAGQCGGHVLDHVIFASHMS